VDQAGIPLALQASDHSSDLPGALSEQPGGLGLGAKAVEDRPEDGEGIAITLAHGNPIGVHDDLRAWTGDRIDRTFLLGPTTGHFYWGPTGFRDRIGLPGLVG
jgi:hypothetical protein